VLAALGVPVEAGPAWSQRSLNALGIGFCFAPHFHPALAKVGPLRRKLGVRTIFNLLGPLLNPAGAEHQLLGVGRQELLDPMAGALALLGTRDALLVCGQDGLDEVSLSGPTMVRRVREGRIEMLEWTPDDFGLAPVAVDELRADGPEASADAIRQMLAGQAGPGRSMVLANAAAALLVSGRVNTLPTGVAEAGRAIDSGAGRRVLDGLCRPAD
jgi:anthranilate phosphoribosyltransferase